MNHRSLTGLCSVVLGVFCLACSESNTGVPASGGGTSTGGTNSGGSAGAGGTGGTGVGGTASGGASGSAGMGGSAGAGGSVTACGLTDGTATSHITINEISASGDDYVELVNTGSAAIDLANLVLADRDDTGCPKTNEALTFPSGASLQPGDHLLIVADQTGATNQVQTSCLNGPASCYHVGFGISASKGDGIFVLKDTTVLATAEVPAGAVTSGESWCLLPDPSGAFAKCKQTPGSANAAP